MSKPIKISLKFFYHRVATPFWFFRAKRYSNFPTGTFLTGASNAGGIGRNRDSEPVSGQVLSTGSLEDHGHRLASYDTSLVVSGSVDCGRRR